MHIWTERTDAALHSVGSCFTGLRRDMSSVDIVVPCFRYAHFLRECVASVLSQSGPELRVLIIDDASPDNTEEIAKELVRSDSRVDYCKHTSNQGLIATANEGIGWARAD